MVECCTLIFEYTSGLTFDNFLSDRKTLDAVIRNFEVLGEASKRIPEEIRLTHPEIEWRKIDNSGTAPELISEGRNPGEHLIGNVEKWTFISKLVNNDAN